METLIFALGFAFFVYELVQWRTVRRHEPIAFLAVLYVIGLALAWVSAMNAPIPAPARWIVPAFKPIIDTISFWLG